MEEELRVRRYRVVRRGDDLSAEKGYLKETGNLLFHLSLIALLLGLAGGKLWGYEGSILVTEGDGFCNSFQQYDTYSSGPLVDGGDLSPTCVDLEDFGPSTSPTSPRRRSPPTSVPAGRVRRAGRRPSGSTTRCAPRATGSTSPATASAPSSP